MVVFRGLLKKYRKSSKNPENAVYSGGMNEKPKDPILQDLEGWPEWAYHQGAQIGPADGTPMVPTQVVGLVRLKSGIVACQIKIEAPTGVETPLIYREHCHNWDWLKRPRLMLVSLDD